MNKLLASIALSACTALSAGVCSTARAADATGPDGKIHKLTLHDGQFWVDDTAMRIFSGEMHPGRIPPDMWEDRIKKAKAMGLNTISIYLFWNEIEPSEGNFVFSGNTDIRRFVQLCQDNGMWVMMRSGPYICGEWEFGGFPAWMLKNKDIRFRTDDPKFLAYCDQYVKKLAEQVGPMQVTHGGPILLVQIENELHEANGPYLNAVRDMYVKAGFDGQLMTCDPSGKQWTDLNSIPGLLRAYNGFDSGSSFAMRYAQIKAVNKDNGYPILSPEVYTGWFNTWGPVRKAPVVAVPVQVKTTQFLLDHKDISFNYYVFDGGTNFGYMAGANNGTPMQTSYDYDAPIDELGRVTPKYKALREVFIKTLGVNPPAVPADPAIIDIPSFTLAEQSPLLDRLPDKAIDSEHVQSMEDVGQNYGFIVYRKQFDSGIHGKLALTNARDYSFILLNGKVVGESMARANVTYTLPVDQAGPCTLDIVVHNLGRDSLLPVPTPAARYRKGLNQDPTLDGSALTGWKIYPMPLENPADLPAAPAAGATAAITGPTFFNGTFNLSSLGETYLDMSNWHCGVVWVNGHNLGRFWDIGSGRSIYLPSSWQKAGANEIQVLELGQPPKSAEIKGVKEMIQTPAAQFKPLWTAAGETSRPAATTDFAEYLNHSEPDSSVIKRFLMPLAMSKNACCR